MHEPKAHHPGQTRSPFRRSLLGARNVKPDGFFSLLAVLASSSATIGDVTRAVHDEPAIRHHKLRRAIRDVCGAHRVPGTAHWPTGISYHKLRRLYSIRGIGVITEVVRHDSDLREIHGRFIPASIFAQFRWALAE